MVRVNLEKDTMKSLKLLYEFSGYPQRTFEEWLDTTDLGNMVKIAFDIVETEVN